MNWLIELTDRLFWFVPRIRLIRPDESGVRITCGHKYQLTPPGWYFVWPVLQEMEIINVMPQVIDIRSQSVLTKDGRDLCFGGGIMYRVSDPVKAILEVQDFDKSLYTLALGIVADYINQNDYNDCTVSGTREAILKGVREAAAGFGLKIMRMYVTDFGTTRNIRVLTNMPITTVIDNMGDE